MRESEGEAERVAGGGLGEGARREEEREWGRYGCWLLEMLVANMKPPCAGDEAEF